MPIEEGGVSHTVSGSALEGSYDQAHVPRSGTLYSGETRSTLRAGQRSIRGKDPIARTSDGDRMVAPGRCADTPGPGEERRYGDGSVY